jgi:hypothetical protein
MSDKSPMHSSSNNSDYHSHHPSISSGFEPTGVAVFSWNYMEPNVLSGARSAPIIPKFVRVFSHVIL